jgi:hypothetical protein
MSLSFVHYLKNEVKTEMKMKILKEEFDKEDLQKFSSNDLKKANWTDENEFVLNGKMYDLVKTKFIKGQKIYYCFQDKKETKIANIETKIHDFFGNSVFKQTEVKPNVPVYVKINNISKETINSILILCKSHFLKSQFQSYQLSVKNSDFIKKLVIPPEV